MYRSLRRRRHLIPLAGACRKRRISVQFAFRFEARQELLRSFDELCTLRIANFGRRRFIAQEFVHNLTGVLNVGDIECRHRVEVWNLTIAKRFFFVRVAGRVIGFEKLNFSVDRPDLLRVAFETLPA
jgi:hypothetical protein